MLDWAVAEIFMAHMELYQVLYIHLVHEMRQRAVGIYNQPKIRKLSYISLVNDFQ